MMPAGTALVIQPHNDDAVIAIGGILLKLIKQNWQIHYLYITDSRFGGNEYPDLVQSVRSAEAAKERRKLGVRDFEELGYPDQSLSQLSGTQREEIIARIRDAMNNLSPDVVFLPSPGDLHPDHRAAHDIAWDALSKATVLLAKYSVWLFPDFYTKPSDRADQVILVGIEEEERKKSQLIRLHASQIARRRYDLATRHLNRYFAYILKAEKRLQVQSAEIIGLYYHEQDPPQKEAFLNCLMPWMDVTIIAHGQIS